MWILIIEILLIILTYEDIKSHEIDIRYVFVCFIILFILERDISISGLIPGIVMLVFSRIMPKHIGAGDGYVFILIGLFTGCMDCMIIMLMASVFGLIYGIIVSKALPMRNSNELPFIPFILISFSEFILFR